MLYLAISNTGYLYEYVFVSCLNHLDCFQTERYVEECSNKKHKPNTFQEALRMHSFTDHLSWWSMFTGKLCASLRNYYFFKVLQAIFRSDEMRYEKNKYNKKKYVYIYKIIEFYIFFNI